MIKVQEVDEAFLDWFAGFVAGEGCFIISEIRNKETWRTELFIRLRDDDRYILLEIQEQLGMGKISLSSPHGATFPNTKPQVCLRFARNSDCMRLVGIFENHPLRAKKQRDFEVWKEAAREICRGRGQRPGKLPTYDRRRLQYLKDKLSLIRAYEELFIEEGNETIQCQIPLWEEAGNV